MPRPVSRAAAGACAVRRLGAEPGLPTCEEVTTMPAHDSHCTVCSVGWRVMADIGGSTTTTRWSRARSIAVARLHRCRSRGGSSPSTRWSWRKKVCADDPEHPTAGAPPTLTTSAGIRYRRVNISPTATARPVVAEPPP